MVRPAGFSAIGRLSPSDGPAWSLVNALRQVAAALYVRRCGEDQLPALDSAFSSYGDYAQPAFAAPKRLE
jgi:hypothetical protein